MELIATAHADKTLGAGSFDRTEERLSFESHVIGDVGAVEPGDIAELC